MNIELHKITVRELAKGYADNNENGVRAYSGRLDVRPPYQREFVYGEKERDAVIDTHTNGFPLNVMYWAVRDIGFADVSSALGDRDGREPNFEIIDGQQRTISICQYVNGDFAFNFRYFHNLQPDAMPSVISARTVRRRQKSGATISRGRPSVRTISKRPFPKWPFRNSFVDAKTNLFGFPKPVFMIYLQKNTIFVSQICFESEQINRINKLTYSL